MKSTSTPQPQTQQNNINLQCVRYKRITSLGGTLISFHKHKDKQTVNQIIEFPLIQNTNEKYESKDACLILSRKALEQQIAKKTSKSLIKQFEENRKKKTDDNMNLLGLDVIKIQCLDHKAKTDNKREDKFNKISKISQKMCEIQSQKDFTKEFHRSQKRRSQKLSTLSNLAKLQMTDSFVIVNKNKNIHQNVNSVSLHNSRNTSTRLFSSEAVPSQITSLSNSPEKKISIRKKEYLYKKLQGVQNKKKQEFGQVYQRRIKSYLDFLFKVQMSYNFSTSLDIKYEDVNNRPKKLKAYVGPGNNGAMIKGLLKRRFWWTIVEERPQDCNFVWTQIKINSIFEKQQKTNPQAFIKNQSQQLQIQSLKLNNNPKTPLIKKRSIDLRDKQKKFFENNELFNHKILNQSDCKVYQKVHIAISQRERQLSYEQRLKYIGKALLNEENITNSHVIHNHLQNNFYLGNKKALFYNLKEYYHLIKKNPFDYIPLTFHIKNGLKDPQYIKFCQYHKKRSKQIKRQEKQMEEEGHLDGKKKTRNIWIVKPGENSNQGRGITVIDEVYQLNNIIKQASAKSISSKRGRQKSSLSETHTQGLLSKTIQTSEQQNTFIVQLYIDRPLLYNNRKFDIRHYMMITNIFGVTRAYWYEEGYIRTSSYQFNIHSFEPQIHLTNDAVQKNFSDYHRYQPYNKVSYEEFQRYLDQNYSGRKYNFKEQILPQMKQMGTDAAKSVFTKISPQNRMNNFQIFGLDFMIDKNFQPWLIEINTNPCLDCACPLLDRIIPYMVEQSFKLTLDTLYPPPHHYTSTTRHFAPLVNMQTFKYELIFDSLTEGEQLTKLYKKVKSNLIDQIGEIEQDEIFKDEGKQIKLDDFA